MISGLEQSAEAHTITTRSSSGSRITVHSCAACRFSSPLYEKVHAHAKPGHAKAKHGFEREMNERDR